MENLYFPVMKIGLRHKYQILFWFGCSIVIYIFAGHVKS